MNISDFPKPSPSQALRKYTLKFNLNEISYILIKNEEFKSKLIAFIKALKTIGGNAITGDLEKDQLISRIITLDQVKRDF